jgi:hypothetical protein
MVHERHARARVATHPRSRGRGRERSRGARPRDALALHVRVRASELARGGASLASRRLASRYRNVERFAHANASGLA